MRFTHLLTGLLISTLFAACSTSVVTPEITLKGTLSQVGNIPFQYLAVRTEDGGVWKLDVANPQALLPMVNQAVLVLGAPEHPQASGSFPERTLHVHSIRPFKP